MPPAREPDIDPCYDHRVPSAIGDFSIVVGESRKRERAKARNQRGRRGSLPPAARSAYLLFFRDPFPDAARERTRYRSVLGSSDSIGNWRLQHSCRGIAKARKGESAKSERTKGQPSAKRALRLLVLFFAFSLFRVFAIRFPMPPARESDIDATVSILATSAIGRATGTPTRGWIDG
jgi:hypothetical protein